jgi:hypothetical protein
MRWMVWLGLLLVAGCVSMPTKPAGGNGRSFEFPQDTFAFANETVFAYRDGGRVADDRPPPKDGERYRRRCFVMARSAVQFWKFARFEPGAVPVDDRELARRVREVVGRGPWETAGSADRCVAIAGYANLWELSAREGKLLRANLGPGWTTYFEPRKFCMPFVPSRLHQQRTHEQMREWLTNGHPMVLWLYNFPRVNINHAVVAYAELDAGEKFAYAVYDPNYTDRPRRLQYDPSKREFSYEETFYFGGGPVHVRPVYLGPFN